MDVSLACRTLLFDVQKRCWSKELVDAVHLDMDMLPDVYEPGSAIGSLTEEAAKHLGLSTKVQVVIGSHDQIVNSLACGVCEPGDAMDGTGTTECIEPLFAEMPDDMDYIRENFACVPYLDGRAPLRIPKRSAGLNTHSNSCAHDGKIKRGFRVHSIIPAIHRNILSLTKPQEKTDFQ